MTVTTGRQDAILQWVIDQYVDGKADLRAGKYLTVQAAMNEFKTSGTTIRDVPGLIFDVDSIEVPSRDYGWMATRYRTRPTVEPSKSAVIAALRTARR